MKPLYVIEELRNKKYIPIHFSFSKQNHEMNLTELRSFWDNNKFRPKIYSVELVITGD